MRIITLNQGLSNIRMISGNGVHEDDRVFLAVERPRLGPTIVVHLVDERTLSDHSTDEFHRKRAIVDVRRENSTGPVEYTR